MSNTKIKIIIKSPCTECGEITGHTLCPELDWGSTLACDHCQHESFVSLGEAESEIIADLIENTDSDTLTLER